MNQEQRDTLGVDITEMMLQARRIPFMPASLQGPAMRDLVMDLAKLKGIMRGLKRSFGEVVHQAGKGNRNPAEEFNEILMIINCEDK